MPVKALLTVAPKTKLLTKSTFKGYDVCLNTYVGCEFGCSYCYVRFFIKDKHKDWGEFVRVRSHLADKLPKELQKQAIRFNKDETIAIPDARLVIGTMTDPYQPVERRQRLTRTALEILLKNDLPHFQKIGIFTRSPLVLQDLGLIKQLPKARVHFTITPFPPEILRAIEPYSPITERRWQTVQELKEAGLRVHVNVSPIMPEMSEPYINDFTRRLAELQVDEYFVDPMQPYKESFDAFRTACQQLPNLNWSKIEQTMLNKEAYLDWKIDYYARWDAARQQHQHLAPQQLPIWSDHEHKVWIDMRTGQQMNPRNYND